MFYLNSSKNILSRIQRFLIVFGVALLAGLFLYAPLSSAATYTVSNLNDSGIGSLRQAIIDANGNAGSDVIDFSGGLFGTIILSSALPTITETLSLDGETATDGQGGADIVIDCTGYTYCLNWNGGSGASNTVKGIGTTGGTNGIVVDSNTTGLQIGNTGTREFNEMNGHSGAGLKIDGASNVTVVANTIGDLSANSYGVSIMNSASDIIIGGTTVNEKNVISNNINDGINAINTSTLTISANNIGVDGAGTSDRGNGGHGINIGTGCSSVTIGGDTAGKRNVISGNGANGIVINSNGSTIEGNYIGIASNGTSIIANDESGVYLQSASNSVGGDSASKQNVISGNGYDGIRINANVRNADDNVIKNNYIGTNLTGTLDLGNLGHGIHISGGDIADTVIGGNNQGNLISGNTGSGIRIVGSNNSTGTTIEGNTIGLTANKLSVLANDGKGVVTQGDSTIIGNEADVGRRNYIGGNGDVGISIDGADNVVVKNNYIGVASNGTSDVGNTSHGIEVINNAGSTTIGGSTINHRNIISGNAGNGITIKSGVTTVEGNYIGTTAGGDLVLANNQDGIRIESSNNVIGGSNSSSRNVISGNGLDGIRIDGSLGSANGNSIKNNYIGTDNAGTSAIANVKNGINIDGNNPQDTIIGGNGEGNHISGNTLSGIVIAGNSSTGTTIEGNRIGLGSDGSTAVGNGKYGISTQGDSTNIGKANESGRRNIISSNGNYGIYINGADSCTIENNYLGIAADGSTLRANTEDAIYIDSTGASNVIGGTSTGAENLIYSDTGKYGTTVASDAGDYNQIVRNTYNTGSTGRAIQVLGTANESIATPVITSATSSVVSGTGPANANIDIYQDGTWKIETTADGSGDWEVHTYFSGTNVFIAATNTNKSTSDSTAETALVADVTPPSSPTLTSSTDATTNASYSASGTKDAYTNVRNNLSQIVAVDENTTWSTVIALAEGVNNLSLTSQDYSLNESSANAYSIILDTITPTTPSISYPEYSSISTAQINGWNTEADANVYVDNTDSLVDVESDGTFIVDVNLAAGINNLIVKIVDIAGNTSGTVAAAITYTGDGGGGGGGGGGSGTTTTTTTTTDDKAEDGQEILPPPDGEEILPPPLPPGGEEILPPPLPPGGEEILPPPLPPGGEEILPPPPGQELPPVYIGPDQVEIIDEGTQVEEPFGEPVFEPIFSEELTQADIFGETLVEDQPPTTLLDVKLKDVLGEDPGAKRDTDGDGITDYTEILQGSDAFSEDGDGDGIPDSQEIYELGTDPLSYDSDKDGIPDNKEEPEDILNYNPPILEVDIIDTYAQENKILDPIGYTDSDIDGVSDYQEIVIGLNPFNSDSDGDGLSDGEEYINYGTNPTDLTSAEELEHLRMTNVYEGESLPQGPQVISGRAAPGEIIRIYDIKPDGEQILIGETKADETGKYSAYTDELGPGEHTLITASGDREVTDLSQALTMSVVENTGVPAPVIHDDVLSDGAVVTDARPTLRVTTSAGQMLVVTWQSAIYSQTMIADVSGETVDIQPDIAFSPGEHTVTTYTVDLETNTKSTPTQIAFIVTEFVGGEADEGISSAWIIGGGAGILAVLVLLAVALKKRKVEPTPPATNQ